MSSTVCVGNIVDLIWPEKSDGLIKKVVYPTQPKLNWIMLGFKFLTW